MQYFHIFNISVFLCYILIISVLSPQQVQSFLTVQTPFYHCLAFSHWPLLFQEIKEALWHRMAWKLVGSSRKASAVMCRVQQLICRTGTEQWRFFENCLKSTREYILELIKKLFLFGYFQVKRCRLRFSNSNLIMATFSVCFVIWDEKQSLQPATPTHPHRVLRSSCTSMLPSPPCLDHWPSFSFLMLHSSLGHSCFILQKLMSSFP